MGSLSIRHSIYFLKRGSALLLSVLIVIGVVCLVGTSSAYASGITSCTGRSCTVSITSPSHKTPTPKPSSPSPTYTPIYPPPEPTCVDQGGYIRPYSKNSNLTIICTRDVGKTVSQSRQL